MIFEHISNLFSSSSEFSEINNKLNDESISIEGVSESSFPLIVSSLYRSLNNQIVVVLKNSSDLYDFKTDIEAYLNADDIITLPSWDVLPYEFVPVPQKIEKERLNALYKIISGKKNLILTNVEALIRKIPEKKFFLDKGLVLKTQDDIPFDDLIETISEYGYSREARVESYGEFTIKGGIIDIFLPSYDFPVRIDFFGDTVESIREFDPVTQISGAHLDAVTIFPAIEILLSPKERKLLAKKVHSFNKECQHLAEYESGLCSKLTGIEDLFPLVVNSDNIASFFNDDCIVVYVDKVAINLECTQIERVYSE